MSDNYYDKLLASDLWNGKMIALTPSGEQAVAGNTIKNLKCLQCNTIFDLSWTTNSYGHPIQVGNVNCERCK